MSGSHRKIIRNLDDFCRCKEPSPRAKKISKAMRGCPRILNPTEPPPTSKKTGLPFLKPPTRVYIMQPKKYVNSTCDLHQDPNKDLMCDPFCIRKEDQWNCTFRGSITFDEKVRCTRRLYQEPKNLEEGLEYTESELPDVIEEKEPLRSPYKNKTIYDYNLHNVRWNERYPDDCPIKHNSGEMRIPLYNEGISDVVYNKSRNGYTIPVAHCNTPVSCSTTKPEESDFILNDRERLTRFPCEISYSGYRNSKYHLGCTEEMENYWRMPCKKRSGAYWCSGKDRECYGRDECPNSCGQDFLYAKAKPPRRVIPSKSNVDTYFNTVTKVTDCE